ncbi:hypothetical protein BDV39DRAFT_209614 [Aspergillus sergii]|uniref:Alpha/beta hydrolase fold-3 domain-containing protein n=1 Tax=Aspergillus sergii TaxID=1034303 RepID=A0A5N6WPP2_9EURO|nr:hypothetical protein BDV39DRAFT_209614 [Aspergillus sergii]
MAGKFSAFDRQDLPYGFVDGHALQATILIPKKCLNGDAQACPMLVYWHGGGFIVGHRTHEPWWSTWLIDLALSQNAIIITPDYRLPARLRL